MAVLVEQAHRETIEFRLAAVFQFGAITEQVAGRQIQPFSRPAIEIGQVLLLERIAEAEHGNFVTHLAKGRQRFATHPLGGRLGGDQLGMLGLQRPQLLEQPVVLGIRHAGLVEHVVAIVMGVDFAAQFGNALGSGLGGRHMTEP